MAQPYAHARAAIRHIELGIERLRARARDADAPRHRRVATEVALHELLNRKEQLLVLHHAIGQAAPDEARRLWSRFLAVYDLFLDRLDEIESLTEPVPRRASIRHDTPPTH